MLRSSHGMSASGYRLGAKSCLSEWPRSATAPLAARSSFSQSDGDFLFVVRFAPESATPLKFADLPSWSERLRCSRPPTRLSASPVRETGLTVLDQLTPGQLAQANIEHRRQEQAEQSNPDHAGEHGDAGRRAHLGAGAM